MDRFFPCIEHLRQHCTCFETAQERLLSMRIIEACSGIGRQGSQPLRNPRPPHAEEARLRRLEARKALVRALRVERIRPAPRQIRQVHPPPLDHRLLLRTRPALDPPLGGDGVGD
jgi:hypothetical protein